MISTKVNNIKSDNYFIGDDGSAKNYVFEMGWIDADTFKVDFGGNKFEAKIPQLHEHYDIAFEFDYDSKVGKLVVDDKEFTHNFGTYYKDKLEFIGRGQNGFFNGAIKKLEVYSK